MSLYLESQVPRLAARYAWVVDETWRANDNDDGVVPDTEFSCNGVTGPHDAPQDLLDRLKAGEGREWRTLYDVDYAGHPEAWRVVHTGRFLACEDADGDAEFGPLDDLSRPDCGAITIQYQQEDGSWKTL